MGFNLEEAVALASSKTMRKLGIREENGKGNLVVEKNDVPFVEPEEGAWINQEVYNYEEFANIAVGKKYVVVWDGKEYICTATGDIEMTFLGVAMDEEGNPTGSEPFLFLLETDSTQGYVTIIARDTKEKHSFAIYEYTETIHPISDKYLPSGGGGGLPVVEITSVDMNNFGEDFYQLNETESATLDKLLKSGAEYLMVHGYRSGVPFVFILPSMRDDTGALAGYMGLVHDLLSTIAVAKEEGAWMLVRESM